MIAMLIMIGFVLPVLGFAAYALVRPFTHLHYRHPDARLWRPLD